MQPRSNDFSIVSSTTKENVRLGMAKPVAKSELVFYASINGYLDSKLSVGDEVLTATAAVINCGGKQKRNATSQPTHVVVDSAVPHKFSDQLLKS